MFPLSNGFARRPGALMRCYWATLLAVLSALATAPAVGADTRAKEQTDVVVQSMLASPKFQDALSKSKGVDPKSTHIVYLVLDHETLNWSVYHSKPPKPGTASGEKTPLANVTNDKITTPLGPDGNPRVVRSGDEKPVLVVVGTNPFLYSYESTVSPPQYSPDAATMGAALSAIGSATLVFVADIDQNKKIQANTELDKKERDEAQKKIEVDQELQNALDKLVKEREKVQSYVRRLETGGDDKSPWPSLDCVAAAAKNGLAALDEFERLAENLPKPRSCYQIWGPLMRLAALPNIKGEDLTTARAEMLKMNAQSDYRCEDVVNKAFDVLEKLDKLNNEDKKKVLCELKKDWVTQVALVSDKVLSAKKDFIAAAAQLEAFVRLASTQALLSQTGGDSTWPLAGKVAVVAPPFPDQTWHQDNPGTISIKPETSVYPECPRLKPTGVDRKFLFVSHRQPFLGFGFGTAFFKSITDPSFGMVHPPDTPNTTQEIGRTSQESHLGTIVAMVFLRARPLFCPNAQPKPLEPGFELGIGLNSKKTALFVGPSFEFYHFLRLGVGLTCQVVTRLADGLKEASFDDKGLPIIDTGTPVTQAGEVRTQSTWKWRLYVGLTFALDALPLFSPSK